MTLRRCAVAALAATVLTLAACGGDDDSADPSATTAASETTETTAASSDTTAAGDSATTATPDTTAAPDDSESDDLDALLEGLASRSFYVAYTITDEDGTESTFVRAQDPPKLLIGTDDSVLVVTDDKAFQCQGSPGSTTDCTELPKEVADQLTSVGAFGILDIGPELAKEANRSDFVLGTEDDTIAGRDARCYRFDASKVPGAPGDAEDFVFCVDPDTGLTLRMVLGGTTVEATEVRDPRAEDFQVS